jgi:hypothetical protein
MHDTELNAATIVQYNTNRKYSPTPGPPYDPKSWIVEDHTPKWVGRRAADRRRAADIILAVVLRDNRGDPRHTNGSRVKEWHMKQQRIITDPRDWSQ